MKRLELWGGVERILNRIGDQYSDQLEKKNCYEMKRISNLGIDRIRLPCLWEIIAPMSLDQCKWKMIDKTLHEVKELNLPLIANFLHHGSGPLYTSLIDPDFPKKFSTFARLFAERYPWVEEYIPIHEIGLSSRVSCLEGKWYPHLQNNTYYFKSLIYQCKASIIAMREIRSVNPRARLIQTEDPGQYHFERDKFLSLDLLKGRVNKDHHMYDLFIQSGIAKEELIWFEENSFDPHAIGTTSGEIIREIWEKYETPIIVSERKRRWFGQVWNEALSLRNEGVNIEAVSFFNLPETLEVLHLIDKSSIELEMQP